MHRLLILSFLLLVTLNQSFAKTVQNEIIKNLINTDNLSFDFEQSVGDKIEMGNCIIKYPKLIHCIYDNKLKKILVSNGKSLVIKNRLNNQYYIYPLRRTHLYTILDKKFLIDKIKNLKIIESNKKNLNLSFTIKGIKIMIFFDKKTFNLVGWQTVDIYQNEVKFKIFNTKINQHVDDKKFNLPKKN